MADPKITVGMKFSTYKEMKAQLSEQYHEVPTKTKSQHKITVSEETYTYKKGWLCDNGQVNLSDTEYGRASKSVFIVEDNNGSLKKMYQYNLNTDGFSYSKTSNNEDDDKFDKILTESQIAVDKNKNGIVDEGEIFDRFDKR